MRRTAAVLLALALALGLWGCAPAETPAAPSPSPAPPAPVLAVFATEEDRWCARLLTEMEDWCAREGWELVEYDCAGHAATQALQVAALAREKDAAAAVLCPVGSAEEAAQWAGRLKAVSIPVLTVTRQAEEPEEETKEGSLCRLAPEGDGLLAAAGAYLKGRNVVLLHDREEEPLEAAAPAALEKAGARVQARSFTWGSGEYAQASLAASLKAAPRAEWVVCFTLTGAEAARAVLRETGKDERVKVLCIGGDAGMLRALECGQLDALATVSPQAAAKEIQTAIPLARRGEAPGWAALEAAVLEPEAQEK